MPRGGIIQSLEIQCPSCALAWALSILAGCKCKDALTRLFTWYFYLFGAYVCHVSQAWISDSNRTFDKRRRAQWNSYNISNNFKSSASSYFIHQSYSSAVRVEYLKSKAYPGHISARSGSEPPTACTSVMFALASPESDSRAIWDTVFLRCYCDSFTASPGNNAIVRHNGSYPRDKEFYNFKDVIRNARKININI